MYADWLEETGGEKEQSRAEFVRVQVRIAAISAEVPKDCGDPGCSACAERRTLQQRERELWETRDEDGWLVPDPISQPAQVCLEEDAMAQVGTGYSAPVLVFRRGFLWRIRCTLADWLAHGPALVAAHPLERVELSDRRPRQGRWADTHATSALAGQPYWAWECLPDDVVVAGYFLAYEVYKYLDGYVSPHVFNTFRHYRSEQDATAALSRACLLSARREAVRREVASAPSAG